MKTGEIQAGFAASPPHAEEGKGVASVGEDVNGKHGVPAASMLQQKA